MTVGGFVIVTSHVVVLLDEIDSSQGEFGIGIVGLELDGFLEVHDCFVEQPSVELGAASIEIGFKVVLVVFDHFCKLPLGFVEAGGVVHQLDASVVGGMGFVNLVLASREKESEQR